MYVAKIAIALYSQDKKRKNTYRIYYKSDNASTGWYSLHQKPGNLTGAWQVERYAGFQPGWLATAFGDRLTDAVLKEPCGIPMKKFSSESKAIHNGLSNNASVGNPLSLPDRSGAY